MSSALDEELRRLEALVANSTQTAVGTKERCVAQIVAAVHPASCRGTSNSQKRRLWVSPLDGAPPRARQRTTPEVDQSGSETIMNEKGIENQTFTPLAALPQHADDETRGGGRSNDAVQRAREINHYQKLLDQCREEDEKHKQEHAKKIDAIRELRRVYLFGLLKVAKLQDLREAPDAIMPGNFVEKNSVPT